MAGGPAGQDGVSGGEEPRERTFAPVRLQSQNPPVGRWLAIAAIALVLVIVKPWPGAKAPPSGPPTGDRRDVPTGAAESVPGPASSLPLEPGRAFCIGPASWLIATVERWKDQTIRVWRAIEPATAAIGPGDPAIPIRPIGAVSVMELGWCSPVEGPDMLRGSVDVHVWRSTTTGWDPVVVSASAGQESDQGALYRPPGRRQSYWHEGRYVLQLRGTEGPDYWLGVELERRRPLD